MFRLLSFIFICIFSSEVFGQNNACDVIKKTDKLVNKKHIHPINLSEAVYHEILNLYLESIDSKALFFTSKDSMLIHQTITSKTTLCELFSQTKPFILKKLKSSDSLIKTLNIEYFKIRLPMKNLNSRVDLNLNIKTTKIA